MEDAIIGQVIECRVIATKNNGPMAFVQVETKRGRVEAVLFPDCYGTYKNLLAELGTLEFRGRLNVIVKEDKKQITVNAVKLG